MKVAWMMLCILSFIGCSEKRTFNERYYQDQLCDRLSGVTEVVLKDMTRVDCLTDTYAIEVDWAKKWAEGIGQSLYYAAMTQRRPAIGIIAGENDARYLKRLEKVSGSLGIKVIVIPKEK